MLDFCGKINRFLLLIDRYWLLCKVGVAIGRNENGPWREEFHFTHLDQEGPTPYWATRESARFGSGGRKQEQGQILSQSLYWGFHGKRQGRGSSLGLTSLNNSCRLWALVAWYIEERAKVYWLSGVKLDKEVVWG